MLTSSQLDILRKEFYVNSWVNPFKGFNRGYRLEPSNSRACRSGTRIYDISVKLPTTEDMSVFLMPLNSVSWIGDKSILSKWVSLTDYCNATGTLITVANPLNGKFLDPSKSFITLINGVSPVLVAPFTNTSVDVNIMKSTQPNQFSITPFEITSGVALISDPETPAILNALPSSMIYCDGEYRSISSQDELPIPSKGWYVSNPSFKYLIRSKVSGLRTFLYKGESFHLIDLGIAKESIYHYTSLHFHLINTGNNIGIAIDRTSEAGNIRQVTNSMIAVRANYIETLCGLANIPVELSMIEIYAPNSNDVYLDNAGMYKTIENVDHTTPTELIANADNRLEFLHAETLMDSLDNQLQMINIPNETLKYEHFDQHVIDNRLMCKGIFTGDTRTVMHTVSGKELAKYANGVKYSKTSPNINDYTFPAIYTASHDESTFGIDYYIGEDGSVTLLDGAYIVDRNGRYEIPLSRPFELIDLSTVPFIDHEDLTLEVIAGETFLHPDIDYILINRQLIVWKEGITDFTISLYFTSFKSQRTFWVKDNEVVIPKHELYALSPRFTVYNGSEVLDTQHRMPAPNGTPVTIENELLDLFDPLGNTDRVHNDRSEHINNIELLSDYYEQVSEDSYPITGFENYYYLVSPFCIDVMAAIRNGEIDISIEAITTKGIENCIPNELMAKLNMGYDPSTSHNRNGSHYVIIKAHDETNLIEISPDEWNFMRHVSSVLLSGRVTLELYYRIKYE